MQAGDGGQPSVALLNNKFTFVKGCLPYMEKSFDKIFLLIKVLVKKNQFPKMLYTDSSSRSSSVPML